MRSVAVAAALAASAGPGTGPGTGAVEPREFLDQVLQRTPPGRVHDGMWAARGLAHVPYAKIAVHELGNGRYTSAHDTVPFALWAAARNLDDFEAAFWTTAQTGGDVDTTCAIVGGVLGARLGVEGLPKAWQTHREPLPTWLTAQFSGGGRG